MTRNVESLAKMHEKHMADHVLVTLCDTEHVKVFLLQQPGTSMFSVQITFTPAGIGICGDFSPGHNGVWSRGYGVGWFAGQLSADYLAEKFLTKAWVPEYCAATLREWAEEADDAEDNGADPNAPTGKGTTLRDIANACEGAEQADIYERLDDAGVTLDDGMPGWGYPIADHADLVAIQAKFAALYAAKDLK